MTPIEERILDCFPSGNYALSGLLRLMDIVESDSVPTAAVECRAQPRLLINPTFVKRHAAKPEQLLMLIMHELHHVLLGHTTLFPTVTSIDNFVFDSVINALISRMFPEPDHLSFLTDYYSDHKFPECMLRPPSRWNGKEVVTPPKAIRELPGRVGIQVAEIYQNLYSETGVSYEEIHDIFPELLTEDALAGVRLLGGHGGNGANTGEFENRSPVLFEVVRSIVEEWPQPPNPIRGRSFGEVLQVSEISPRPIPSNRTQLRGLLRRLGERHTGGRVRRIGDEDTQLQTPLPVFDRRSIVLRALGEKPLLHSTTSTLSRMTSAGDRVHVYVDVSGSMKGVVGAVYAAINDCREWVHPVVHTFSDTVSDAKRSEIVRGIVRSTGGTDIACVAKHMANHRVRRACIVTDGWVGRPRGGHRMTLERAKLGVALVGRSVNTTDLSEVTDRTVTLTI